MKVMVRGKGEAMQDPSAYFTVEQIERILKATKNTPKSRRNYILLLTLYLSARRVSEVVGNVRRDPWIPGLRVMDIDWENQQITWSILKRRKSVRKTITMPEELFEPLREYTKEMDIEVNEKVFKISRQRVHQVVRNVCEEAGIERVGDQKPHAHMFRHSFAVHFVKAGNDSIQDLRWLKEYLGHANINNTMTYLQFSTKGKEKLEKMPKFDMEV